jgi:NAD(P)-dependent dehydrogenase (short-subunit alcohol dehydrogenase family)
MTDAYKNKIAIVTGGASGMGRALALDLGRQGASVVIADIDTIGAGKAVQEIRGQNGQARFIETDVAQREQVYALVEETLKTRGRLDYMFNIAGIGMGGEFQDMTPEMWKHVVDVDVLGVLYGCEAAYRAMIEQKSGHIVNMASMTGLYAYPIASAYSMSKFAVVGLSQSLRSEGYGYGIKVSVICPGLVDTPLFQTGTMVGLTNEEMLATVPLRFISAERAAESILKGVQRNKNFIVFPFYARLAWWLYRIHPNLFTPLNKALAHRFRRIKKTAPKG